MSGSKWKQAKGQAIFSGQNVEKVLQQLDFFLIRLFMLCCFPRQLRFLVDNNCYALPIRQLFHSIFQDTNFLAELPLYFKGDGTCLVLPDEATQTSMPDSTAAEFRLSSDDDKSDVEADEIEARRLTQFQTGRMLNMGIDADGLTSAETVI